MLSAERQAGIHIFISILMDLGLIPPVINPKFTVSAADALYAFRMPIFLHQEIKSSKTTKRKNQINTLYKYMENTDKNVNIVLIDRAHRFNFA